VGKRDDDVGKKDDVVGKRDDGAVVAPANA
jgi:hypothetical protein